MRGAVARLAEDAFARLDAGAAGARAPRAAAARGGRAPRAASSAAASRSPSSRRPRGRRVVIDLLADARLLTVSAGTVEFAHEALLREWPRLRDWIEEDREDLRVHRSLSSAAQEWLRLGRDEGALYRGARLAEARGWAERGDPGPDATRSASSSPPA